jgi:hypothetical protein
MGGVDEDEGIAELVSTRFGGVGVGVCNEEDGLIEVFWRGLGGVDNEG